MLVITIPFFSSISQPPPPKKNSQTGREVFFVQEMLCREVEVTLDACTLLRRNCMATKTLSSFFKERGKEYMRDLLLSPIEKVKNFEGGFELDPNKAEVFFFSRERDRK